MMIFGLLDPSLRSKLGLKLNEQERWILGSIEPKEWTQGLVFDPPHFCGCLKIVKLEMLAS